jgi:flagellar biosynthesis protein FlhB
MSGNKTEKPTPKKLRDARKKGMLPRSVEFAGSLSMLILITLLVVIVPAMVFQIKTYMGTAFASIDDGEMTPVGLVNSVTDMFRMVIKMSAPILIMAFFLMILILYIHAGAVVKPVKTEGKNLNLFAGFRAMFRSDRLLESPKMLLKILAAGTIGFFTLAVNFRSIASSWLIPNPSGIEKILGFLVFQLAIRIGGVFLGFGIVDLFYRRYKWRKDLMMTNAEIKNEYKEMEGDPQIKAMRNQLKMELAYYDQIEEVRKSNVVLVNPTHLAVALKYDESSGRAPRITAKGARKIAEMIRRVATEKEIPVIRNEVLARQLFVLKEGTVIPESMFEAVAEVMIFVHNLSAEERRLYR